MRRTALVGLLGFVVGVLLTAVLLAGTAAVLRWSRPEKVFELDHGVIHLSLVFGGGCGAIVGAVIGLAGSLHDRPSRGD